MRSERFIAVALPHSSSPDAEWHVTAFITPKLDTDEEGTTLAGYPLFADWARKVDEGATFTLWDQAGPMETARIDTEVDPSVWDASFPPATPVQTNRVPNWEGREQVSYPAAATAQLAKALHLQTAFLSLDNPPRPSEHVLGPVFRRLAESGLLSVPGRPREDLGDVDAPPSIREFSEVRLREELDEGQRGVRRLRNAMLPPRPSRVDVALVDGALALLQTMHAAARYFDPATPADPADVEPTPLTEPPPRLAPVEGEFHRRVSAAGEHPGLLRALRLAVRLKADPARLRASQWLAVEVAIDGDLSIGRFPRSAVAHPAGDALVTATRPGDTTSVDGALALGEPPYAVMDVDPDGTALKQYNYLLGFVRTIAAEDNGDDVTAAVPALRAPGLIVTRAGRSDAAHASLAGQLELERQLEPPGPAADGPLLHSDQITKGMQIEVWDNKVKRWSSLHTRISTVTVEGFPDPVAEELRNEGLLQGTAAHERPPREADGRPAPHPAADAAIHIHETVFGWEGWSLSAPRPGKTIADSSVPDADSPTGYRQKEQAVADPAASDPRTPPHPFRVTHRAADRTLPRLRYGRWYSFRAWSVDLAGDVRAHELNPQPLPPAELAAAAVSPKVRRLLRARESANSLAAAEGVPLLQRSLRDAATSRLTAARRAAAEPLALENLPAGIRTALAAAAGADGIARAAGSPTGSALDRSSVAQSVWEALAASKAPLDIPGIVVGIDDQLDLIGSHLAGIGAAAGAAQPDAVANALKTVTPLFPFLRWHPVPPPAIVAYGRFTEGESLRTIAIRTGVSVHPDSGEPVLREGDAYLDDVETRHPGLVDARGYRDAGRRHVAPPRIAQADAELHGRFDAALTDPSDDLATARDRVLAWSLRENGSFFSQRVVDIAAPLSAGLEQSGIGLVADNGADPARLRTLAELQPGEPPERGNAPGPGQYVVHRTETLRLPYLPDPVAAGLSITFVDAGFTIPLSFPHRSEGFTVRYPGDWPEKEPLFVVLRSGPAGADLTERRLTITLPPGERVKVRFSSAIDPAFLDHLALWTVLSWSPLTTLDLRDEVLDGRIWSITPGDGVVFVNATPRPVKRPVLIDDPFVLRSFGSNRATLMATFTAHGASTENLTVQADWTDDVDDLAVDGPGIATGRSIGLTAGLAAWETIIPFLDEPTDYDVAELGRVRGHSGRHEFPDTRHRVVTYRLRAQTRYKEYFPSELLSVPMLPALEPGGAERAPVLPDTATAPDGSDAAVDDGQSLVGRPFSVHVDNTSVPAIPRIHSVLPLQRWERDAEPGQPAARRHVRRAGIRIYLERPWYDTGSGELLAVLLNPGGESMAQDAPEWHSQWGSDPIWAGTPIPVRSLGLSHLDHVLRWQDDDERPARPGRPVGEPMRLTLPEPPTDSVPRSKVDKPFPDRRVLAVGYRPQYNPSRRLWYVDVAFDADAAFWPFVRLSVARFQPHSVDGAHLSLPVRLDFAQLLPTRTASVSRTDERTVRVVVGGSVLVRGLAGRKQSEADAGRTAEERFDADRRVVATLQSREHAVDGDLAWLAIATGVLARRQLDVPRNRFVCEGELVSDRDIPLRTPQDRDDAASWRILIEEWEDFPADPAAGHPDAPDAARTTESRLIFADEMFL